MDLLVAVVLGPYCVIASFEEIILSEDILSLTRAKKDVALIKIVYSKYILGKE
jgi:hypothetical protein